jgi:hypothetical protein
MLLTVFIFVSCEQKLITLDNCSTQSKECQNLLPEAPDVTQGTISVLQSTNKGYNSSDFSTTTSDAMVTQLSSNFLVFISKENFSDTTGYVTDNMGNTFTEILSSNLGSSGSWDDGIVAYTCLDCVGGAGHEFTSITNNAAASIFVIEILSTSTLQLGNTIAANIAQTNPILSGSIPIESNSLLVAFATSGEHFTDPVYTWNNDFTKQTEIVDDSFWYGSVATRNIVSAGNYEASMSTSLSGDGMSFLIELKL